MIIDALVSVIGVSFYLFVIGRSVRTIRTSAGTLQLYFGTSAHAWGVGSTYIGTSAHRHIASAHRSSIGGHGTLLAYVASHGT